MKCVFRRILLFFVSVLKQTPASRCSFDLACTKMSVCLCDKALASLDTCCNGVMRLVVPPGALPACE